MKKFYILGIIAVFLLPLGVKANHIHATEITASAVSCQNNTYDITISVYGDSGADAEFSGNGILKLGFGQPIDISLEREFLQEEIQISENETIRVDKLIFRNIEFPGPGNYALSFRTFSRQTDVTNIRHSINTPLYVESRLFIDPFLCNNTPRLSDTVNYFAYTGSTFLQNLGAIDADGDSLSVEFTTPLQNTDEITIYYGTPLDIDLRYATNPTNEEGNGAPTLTVNPDALVWNAPNLPGKFTMAMRVNEWRKINGEWQQLGYVTRDLTVQVLDTVNNISHTDIITSTRQEEPDKPKVQLFPNPNQGDFTLNIQDDTWRGATASIHNIIGLEIDQRTVTVGENPYSLPDCQPGIYFLTLRQGDLQKVLRFMKR